MVYEIEYKIGRTIQGTDATARKVLIEANNLGEIYEKLSNRELVKGYIIYFSILRQHTVFIK